MLQWGRAQMSAEMSMRIQYAAQTTSWLQWGRAQMSAEMNQNPTNGVAAVMLQWGRAQMSAEIYLADASGLFDYSLQWGRAQMSAEILVFFRTWEPRELASMGPRSNERGNATAIAPSFTVEDLLQWGRAQMSAEIRLRPLRRG